MAITTSTRPGRIWRGNGNPATVLAAVPTTQIQNDDVYLDYTNKLSYIRQAKVWNVDSENPFFKPKGDTGASGVGSLTTISPDDYGATHSTQTFAGAGLNQSYINANYPGVGAVTTDIIDWAAWQMAINVAVSTGKMLMSYGSYYINHTIKIPKYINKGLRIFGSTILHPTVAGLDVIKHGNNYNGTSSTNLNITTGSKTIVTNTGLVTDLGTALTVGSTITLFNGSSNYISGTLTSYNSGTGSLTVNINTISGWIGNGTENNNSWLVYFSDYDTPTPGAIYFGSNIEGDSITMGNHKVIIDGIRVSNDSVPANGRCGIGIHWYCSYGLKILNGQFVGCSYPVKVYFALRTLIDNCFSDGCLYGFTATYGDWYSATTSNAQSNHTTMSNCRAYLYDDAINAYAFYAVSGGKVIDSIIEGTQCENGIDFNGNGSPNVLDFGVENVHMECNYTASAGETGTGSISVGTGSKSLNVGTGKGYQVGLPIMFSAGGGNYMTGFITSYSGSTLTVNMTATSGSGTYSSWMVIIQAACKNAFLRVRMLAGVVTLRKTYGQYACILVDVEGTSSTVLIDVTHVPYWVPLSGASNNTLFRMRGNVNLYLEKTDNLYTIGTDLVNKFNLGLGWGSYSPNPGLTSILCTYGSESNGGGNKHTHINHLR